MQTIQQLETQLSDAQAQAETAMAALIANPSDRESAISKVTADATVEAVRRQLEAERTRAEAERRSALELELETIEQRLSRAAITAAVKDLTDRECELRVGLIAVAVERDARITELDALDRRRQEIERTLTGSSSRSREPGSTVWSSTAREIDERLQQEATKHAPPDRPTNVQAHHIRNLVAYARSPR